MKKLKVFSIVTLSATFLGLSVATFADTLTFNISDSGTMTGQMKSGTITWHTMTFAKYSTNQMKCTSDDFGCTYFQLSSVVADDWNDVYNKTVTWEMYDIVKKAGGTKTFKLSDPSSPQINAIKLLKK